MQTELFLDPLLVRVHGFRADAQAAADLWRRVSMSRANQDFALSLGEPLELPTLTIRDRNARSVGHARSACRASVLLPARDGSHRLDELVRASGSCQISACTGYQQ